ncbi:uncharacterized protein LOC126744899 [Anthonomus grandis grandis]|uniref:uncharacterized protein LOC126744899 n=1 Tax=Anthonomus grandis grandis TaxID=2921223 RepID=UPI0021665290|nr:uncharacterized protein LOC126744899 [Anthonomus grandis grandis]
MKIPFHTVVGPLLRRNKHYINTVCSHPALGIAPLYVGVLGILGVILSIFDIYRIIKCGPILPGYLYRERTTKHGKVISPEAERDCKLISLVLSAEYYFFLLTGIATNNPIFFMPFIGLYAVIITLEFIVFVTRTFVDGFNIQKKALFMTLFMMYNWAAVACTFARSMSCCDL